SVGDSLDVWVVDVDQQRRRVSLTAIPPGSERPRRPARSERGPRRGRSGKPRQQPASQASQAPPAPHVPPARTSEKPRARRPKGPPRPVVPITKAMEEGREPMRTFSDLKQFFEKKKGLRPAGDNPSGEPTQQSPDSN